MQYINIFSDSQAAIKALDSNTITSSVVKQTIESLNALAHKSSRLEICWIKAHIGHLGNERADQLAREAAKYSEVILNTPPSWTTYKQAIKTQIYSKWKDRWISDNAYRTTKIFYPKPHSGKAK